MNCLLMPLEGRVLLDSRVVHGLVPNIFARKMTMLPKKIIYIGLTVPQLVSLGQTPC